MIFTAQKGDTKVEEQFFTSDDKYIRHLILPEPIEGLVMILENRRGNVLTVSLDHDLNWVNVSDFGWIWFRFKAAKTDIQIELTLAKYEE